MRRPLAFLLTKDRAGHADPKPLPASRKNQDLDLPIFGTPLSQPTRQKKGAGKRQLLQSQQIKRFS
jgi:hypothetical protein